MTLHTYGYGIVDKDGKPWCSEACVCQDREPMDEQVDTLNDSSVYEADTRAPYKVVRLVFEDKRDLVRHDHVQTRPSTEFSDFKAPKILTIKAQKKGKRK
jgi:hypothetical protein